MRQFIIYLGLIAFSLSCNSQTSNPKVNDMHTGVVLEVLQATEYTYLRVSEGNEEFWVALPKMNAVKGETYYFKGGFMMKDFESKDLGRKFEEIYFIDGVSKEPLTNEQLINQTTLDQHEVPQNILHEVVVKEILQAVNYTYLRVSENSKEHWVALPKTEAKIGATYYYENGALMVNFESKDLKRVFEEVFFISGISDQPTNINQPQPHTDAATNNGDINENPKIKIEPLKDGITVAQLFANLNKYSNKVIKIKGQVTKYNSQIMGKNWVHIQDGTNHAENMDITATTSSIVNMGDVVIVEGKITLKKDFGHGYFYEVIFEDAKVYK